MLLLALAAPAQAKEVERRVQPEELDALPPPKGFKGRSKVLRVPLHYQQTAVWCWAASISMVNEFFYKHPIDDCEVTSKINLKQGGNGKCCNPETMTVDRQCYKGATSKEITEVSTFYFHLHVDASERPLSWNELMSELDAGHPPIAGLRGPYGPGHAVVIFGYAEPGFVFYHDPVAGPIWTSYRSLVSGEDTFMRWRLTWMMKPADRTEYGSRYMPEPVAKASGDTGLSNVSFALPGLSDATDRKAILARLDKESAVIRACYEQALQESPPANDAASLTISFLVEKGDPMLLRVTSSTGSTKGMNRCITDAIVRWKQLFPVAAKYQDGQKLQIELSSLQRKPAAETSRPATLTGTTE
jgi:hypothetical protein